MTPEDHTRKQVQLHIAATNIAKSFASNALVEFGDVFHNNKVFYAVYNGKPIAIEQYVDGMFEKYVNNDGNCMTTSKDEIVPIYEKAQCLVHFSYIKFQRKLMLLHINGSKYMLYDPEIATSQLVGEDESDEIYFCAGNLSVVAIERLISIQKCNNYCQMLNLEEM